MARQKSKKSFNSELKTVVSKKMTIADSVIFELEALTYKEVMSATNENTALACTEALFNCLYLNFKSRLMYIPSTHKMDLKRIRAAILSDPLGNNYKLLALKYKVTEQHIYAILKDEKKRYIKKVQNDLFPIDDKEEEQHKKPITLLVIEEYLPKYFERCGLSEDQSISLAQKLSYHLCQNFPGISIVISQVMKKKRDNSSQHSIFNI